MISKKFQRTDMEGQVLHPGDICARSVNDKVELVVYKEDSYGGAKSKGEFGRFITSRGVSSIKYTSVVFVFDPLSPRRARFDKITSITKKFYEERK